MQVWSLNATKSRALIVLALWLAAVLTTQAQTLTTPSSPFGESRFLPVEQAFPYQVSIDSQSQLTVIWQIAPRYYLYQDKFRFLAQPGEQEVELTVELDEAVAHHDEYFGDVLVYYGTATARVTLPAGLPEEFTLLVEYQGCSEDGLCYPLQRDQVPILL